MALSVAGSKRDSSMPFIMPYMSRLRQRSTPSRVSPYSGDCISPAYVGLTVVMASEYTSAPFVKFISP